MLVLAPFPHVPGTVHLSILSYAATCSFAQRSTSKVLWSIASVCVAFRQICDSSLDANTGRLSESWFSKGARKLGGNFGLHSTQDSGICFL